MPYYIEYSPVAEDHLFRLTARHRAILLDAVEKQLSYEPMVETMPIRLTQLGALGYDPAHARLPSHFVGVSAFFP